MNIKNYLSEQLNEVFDKTLDEDIEHLKSFGDTVKDSRLTQTKYEFNVWFSEICHIRPKNPKFKPGTLLTSPDGIDFIDEDSRTINLSCSTSPECGDNFNIGVVKEISDLGEAKRYLKSETVMVMDEFIQIKKQSRANSNKSFDSFAEEKRKFYDVTHVIQALNNKRKILIPTNMFKQDNADIFSSRSLTISDRCDCNYIMKIYETSSLEDIIRPLKIFTSPNSNQQTALEKTNERFKKSFNEISWFIKRR